LKHSEAEHSINYWHIHILKCVYLILYVNDLVITWKEVTIIAHLKQHLYNHFQNKSWVFQIHSRYCRKTYFSHYY